ncbi:sigma-70 family RNA polymerase sigma factor [Alienimonas sp. DA493]|uniref:sigma-70 family RNA polymerase sigma factor n=1 Tax=Alienimonas sp. DA493 TaxID=3373605 RepID=UPI00375484B0
MPTSTADFVAHLTAAQNRLYAYVLSLVLDPNEAEDVLQQTNTVLWEKADQFEPGTNFIAWAFRVAYYEALASRKKRLRDKLVFDDALLDDLAARAEKLDNRYPERQKRLRDCLEKLNDRQRTFVRLRYSGTKTLDQIAAEADLTTNALKQALFRARAALIRCVNAGSATGATS